MNLSCLYEGVRTIVWMDVVCVVLVSSVTTRFLLSLDSTSLKARQIGVTLLDRKAWS